MPSRNSTIHSFYLRLFLSAWPKPWPLGRALTSTIGLSMAGKEHSCKSLLTFVHEAPAHGQQYLVPSGLGLRVCFGDVLLEPMHSQPFSLSTPALLPIQGPAPVQSQLQRAWREVLLTQSQAYPCLLSQEFLTFLSREKRLITSVKHYTKKCESHYIAHGAKRSSSTPSFWRRINQGMTACSINTLLVHGRARGKEQVTQFLTHYTIPYCTKYEVRQLSS